MTRVLILWQSLGQLALLAVRVSSIRREENTLFFGSFIPLNPCVIALF